MPQIHRRNAVPGLYRHARLPGSGRGLAVAAAAAGRCGVCRRTRKREARPLGRLPTAPARRRPLVLRPCRALPNLPVMDLSLRREGYLTGHLLVAMPGMSDTRFARSVIFLFAHTAEGAMGIVINRELESITFDDLMEQLDRSEEHTSELQSLMRISYAVFC